MKVKITYIFIIQCWSILHHQNISEYGEENKIIVENIYSTWLDICAVQIYIKKLSGYGIKILITQKTKQLYLSFLVSVLGIQSKTNYIIKIYMGLIRYSTSLQLMNSVM